MRPASGSPRWSASGAPWPPTHSPVLRGACDPLSSPRPLGPLVDVASHLDPQVDELLRSGERDGLFEAALASLEAMSPAVLVIEDLHWADMSTLDLVRFLARRLEGTHVLVVATYRDDHLQPSDPLRVVLGDIASQSVVRRVEVPLLSPAAVAELAAESGIDAAALHRETGGNAFFVTEVVAAGGGPLPGTVQDAVLARVQRLSPLAQRTLETAAVVGSRVEPALVHALPDVTTEAVDECVSAGMLHFEAPAYGFRHEIVRQAVLSGITPGRLGALHWQVLDRLRAMPMSPRPFARLAEHAEMAGDGPATLEFAVAAGDAAASLGSHREAAFQYGRAMPYAGLLDADARIELLMKRAAECQTSDDHEHAIAAWEEALVLLRAAGRDLDVVEALMGIDESYFTIGDNSRATDLVDEALAVLDGVAPCRQLALAICRRGSHHLWAYEFAASLPWLDRAIEMGREVGDHEVVSRALSSQGVRPLVPGPARSRPWSLSRRRSRSRSPTTSRTPPRGTTRTWPALEWMDFDLVEAHEQLRGSRALHGRARPARAAVVRAGQRDHPQGGHGPLGRSRGAGARPALRAEHRAGQPDPAAGGPRPAECAARRRRRCLGTVGRGARPHREVPVVELPGLHRNSRAARCTCSTATSSGSGPRCCPGTRRRSGSARKTM